MIYFLDYYHPYAGLCNQLYLITNHIHDAFTKGVKLYIHKFNIDIFKKKRVPFHEIVDIHTTNENIKRLTGVYILEPEKPKTIEFIPKLCIYPVSSMELLNCIEFHKQFHFLPGEMYNGIHFRLELDSLIVYLFGKDAYQDFMDRVNLGSLPESFPKNFMDLPEVKHYIDFLLSQYFSFIQQFGFDKIWFISTVIGKKDIQNVLIPTLKRLTDFIEQNGGKWFVSRPYYEYRELNALVDLILLKNSDNLIGFEGSSYSEGYCLKVNSVNGSNKNFLFVQGIVPYLNHELYERC